MDRLLYWITMLIVVFCVCLFFPIFLFFAAIYLGIALFVLLF